MGDLGRGCMGSAGWDGGMKVPGRGGICVCFDYYVMGGSPVCEGRGGRGRMCVKWQGQNVCVCLFWI